jgi:16S rRNA (guanine527-N7)-methyltransferase
VAEILAGVSRETRAALDTYVAELRRWQAVKNLVGPKTLDEVWSRHIADSAQLAPLAEGEVWADLGSGAGFPGLVLALVRPGTLVHLIESDGRKCAFLREAARLCGARAQVWNERIEAVLPRVDPAPDVIVSRALAPLADLLRLAFPALSSGATGLFLKGRSAGAELTSAGESWTFDADLIPSRTDREGCVVRVKNVQGRQ